MRALRAPFLILAVQSCTLVLTSNYPLHRLQKRHHGHGLRQISLCASSNDSFFVPFSGVGGHRKDRNGGQSSVLLHGLYQVGATDMGQLNVHNDKVGSEYVRLIKRQPSIADPFNFKLMRPQKVGEQLEVEFIVLNNHHLFTHSHIFPLCVREVHGLSESHG